MRLRNKALVLAAVILVSLAVTAALYAGQIYRSGGVATRYVSLNPRPKRVTTTAARDSAMAHTRLSRAENGNGIAEVFADPVRFQDATGTWQDIDTTIILDGSRFRIRAAGYGLMFGRGYGDAVRLIIGDIAISYMPVKANSPEAFVTGNRAVYRDIYAATDLERVALAQGVKETLILQQPGHPKYFETALTTELDVRLEGDGSVGYYDRDKRVAFSPAPFVVDANAKHRRATYSLDGDILRLTLPKDVSALDYPVKVDPTTYIVSDVTDGHIGYDDLGTSYVYTGNPLLEAAYDEGLWLANAWMKFPLAGIDGPIISASLNVYLNNRIYTTGSFTIPVDHVPDFGVLDETDWGTAPYVADIDAAPVTNATTLGWHSLDVTPYVADDLTNFRSASAYRLRMTGGPGTFYARFNASESAASRPYLRIVYAPDETILHSEITTPVDPAFLTGASYTVRGTATPRDGGAPVTLVEVSTDGGATWDPAVGTANWTYEWTLPGDGLYIVKSRATDGDGAVESPPPGVRATVDNTPPVTAITSPLPDQVVGGPMQITGTAADENFTEYRVEYGKGPAPTFWIQYDAAHTTPVTGGTLETVNTYRLTNDIYTFRVTTKDAAGTTTAANVTVTVDNLSRPGSPHGNYQLDTDLCALCHGTHTALMVPGLLKLRATNYQATLCYTCHDGTGSVYDIATEFDTNPSHHPIKDSTYGGDSSHTMLCSECHDAHGSAEVSGRPYPRLLRTRDGSGNKFYQGNAYCYACHGQGGLIADRREFETNNGHNNTDPDQTTVMPNPGSGTMIKCSICHEPHGGQQTRLRVGADKDACGSCHPETAYTLRDDNEVVTGVGLPDTPFSHPWYAGVRVFAEDTFNAPPVAIKGPEEQRTPTLAFPPRTRGVAVGDATNHGKSDIVATIADGANSMLSVWAQADAGYSLKPVSMYDGRGGYGVAIGDVNTDGLKETVITSLGAPNVINVLTIMGDAILSSYSLNTGGTSPREVAIGDITGDGLNDVVVANYGSNTVSVFKQSGGMLNPVPPPVGSGGQYPYGVAIGDVNSDGTNEVVVANQGYQNQMVFNQDPPYNLDNIAVFTSDVDGNLTLSRLLSNGDATTGWDVAVGNVLDNAPGLEIVVAGHPLWPSGLTTQGQVSVLNINDESTRIYNAGSVDSKGVIVEDVDGNGNKDAVVLNSDSVSVLAHGAADLASPAVYPMAGMNTVGVVDEPGAIAAGNVGRLHPYGHRMEVMGVCTDCHNPHAVTKAAPNYGVSGVEPDYGPPISYNTVAHVLNDYQLCYKCHSGAAVPIVGPRNTAEEFNPANQSYHAVMAAGKRGDMPAGSFVAPWNQTSRLKCADCHGKDAAAPQLRHGSANAYLLRKPYAGSKPNNAGMLCYSCHDQSFYGTGVGVVGDYFWERANSANSHHVHSNRGINCATCHDVHGSAGRPGIIRPDMNMLGNAPGPFLCQNVCH